MVQNISGFFSHFGHVEVAFEFQWAEVKEIFMCRALGYPGLPKPSNINCMGGNWDSLPIYRSSIIFRIKHPSSSHMKVKEGKETELNNMWLQDNERCWGSVLNYQRFICLPGKEMSAIPSAEMECPAVCWECSAIPIGMVDWWSLLMQKVGLCVPGDGVCRFESVWAAGELCMPLAEMEPWKCCCSSPCSIPANPEGEAGPDAGSPASHELGRQSSWGWGAGTARLSQLGEMHLIYQVLCKSLLRLRGRSKIKITPIPLRHCLWLCCPGRINTSTHA